MYFFFCFNFFAKYYFDLSVTIKKKSKEAILDHLNSKLSQILVELA